MKKFFLPLVISLFIFSFINAQQKVIQLYDGPAPGSETWNWEEKENDKNSWQTKVVYNVSKPTLTVFAPDADKANGTAMIIAPGGGFHALSINSEGYDVAKWLVQKGVTCFVLKYRLIHCLTNDPTEEFTKKLGTKELEDETSKLIPLAIADARNAIAYVRKHATEFNIATDRIGFIGFSAGGTLAASVAFSYSKENKPDFFAPIYPFFPSFMHGTIANDAPPLFTVTATDDHFGFAPHSVDLYSKWIANKKDAEMHLYAKGNHGFGMRKQNLPTDSWIERFYDWMGVQGLLTKKAPANTAFDSYQKKEYVYADGKILPYRVLYPENYDKTKKYPLILFLHGSGERGNDNEKQLTHGAKLFLKDENRKNFPAIVVFPQCPQESSWASVKVDRTVDPAKRSFDYTEEVTWPLQAANDLVRKLSNEEGVDKSKVYISGLSMGGMGTFESVYRNPDLYAAALPICGGGDVNHYDKRITKTAFWIFHGDADASVDVKLSREMVDKLKSLKAEVKYSEYPGVKHNSWDNAFAEAEYLSWMFGHKKEKVNFMQQTFHNHVAVVTGAGQGIGFEIARQLALQGASVVVNDIDENLTTSAVNKITNEGGICDGFAGDASNISFISQMVEYAVKRFGKLTIAIANAGITLYADFFDYTPDAFEKVMKLNLGGSFFLAQAAARQMKKQETGGSILFMSSVVGHQAHKNLAAYAITKAGLEMLAKNLVIELSPYKITVNTIAPGATLTERTTDDKEYEKTWSRITPIGKPATTTDIANAALFLVSPNAAHITGQSLIIDGGWTSVSPSPY